MLIYKHSQSRPSQDNVEGKQDNDEVLLPLPSSLQIKCTVSKSNSIPPSVSNQISSNMVTEIDLCDCGLSELPEIIGRLSSLRKINAANNSLICLPDTFRNLKELEVAFFLGCEFRTLPQVLGKLPKLFMLSFKNNNLEYIPEDSLPISLGWLILSDNNLCQLPQSLGRLSGLRKLMLAGNQLKFLPSSLADCTSLELIRLSDNQLQTFPSELMSLPKLAWIALAGNDFNRAASRNREVSLVNGHVEVDSGAPLGCGASGVVHLGVLSTHASSIKVAIKLYRDSKTSDGSPTDEMAAAAAAGATDCPHLMRSFGKLPIGHPANGVGLVLEYLEDYDVLGQPPSFQSVTRDQYDGARSFKMETILGILRSICGAATVLHEIGLEHGDLYAHNVLVKGGDTGDGFAVLSDFGASFFYKGKAGVSKQDAKLLERLEVLAFGYLMFELLNRLKTPGKKSGVSCLRSIASSCCVHEVAARPSFSQLRLKLLQEFDGL